MAMQQVDETQQANQPNKKPLAPMAPRWAALIGMLAFGLLYAALPPRVTIGPGWLPLAIEAVLLIPLLVSGITQRPLRNEVLRVLIFALLSVVTIKTRRT